MAQVTPVGTIDVGIFINPNTFTRQIAKSYEILGSRINLLSVVFTSGQRAPVRPSDTRWTWNTPTNFPTNSSISDSANGLDGTSLYVYAGSDYLLKNNLFLQTNPDLTTEKRPATIYEAFLNMLTYIDLQITTRYSSVVAAAADAVASTGDITFSGVKIIGAGVASSDGLNAGTIQLVPDINLYGNNQYVVIDPTTVDHIHIRGGGPIDESLATLILGGEKSNITISDESSSHVTINSRTQNDLSSHIWAFNNNGSVSFPLVSVDLHNGGIQTAETLGFGMSGYQSVITNVKPAIDTHADRIIIQGQRGTGLGEGGDVYVWGGDSDVDAGDIKIYAGDCDGVTGEGGYVYLEGGYGATTGGELRLYAGNSEVTGGNVLIKGGNAGTTPGSVYIYSNSHPWTFNDSGNFVLPSGGDIVDSDNSTVVSGGNHVAVLTSADGPYTLTNAANIILVDFSSSPDSPQITLPDSSETWLRVGYEITIADVTGGAATNNIQILAGASDAIVGAPDGIAIDTDYGLLNLKYVGSQMWLMMYGR